MCEKQTQEARDLVRECLQQIENTPEGLSFQSRVESIVRAWDWDIPTIAYGYKAKQPFGFVAEELSGGEASVDLLWEALIERARRREDEKSK